MKLHPYEKTLLEVCQSNQNVIICTAETRFAMREIPDILNERFLDVGIAEQTLIGMAAGLSKMGMIPICHALASFLLMRPYEFIRTDLGYPNLKALLVGLFNGFNSQANGPTHQAIDDISLMSQVPNMKIIVPGNLDETCELIKLACNNIEGPIYLRFSDLESNNHDSSYISWNDNTFVREGEKTLVISYGLCFNILNKVLQNSYKSIGLVNCIFLFPLDEDFTEKVFSKYNNIIVVEDHRYQGSLCYQLKHHAFNSGYKGKITGINLEDRFFKPALLNDLLQFEGFSEQQLKQRIEELI